MLAVSCYSSGMVLEAAVKIKSLMASVACGGAKGGFLICEF